jgi:Ca2+-binding EF-hand superfamily protein
MRQSFASIRTRKFLEYTRRQFVETALVVSAPRNEAAALVAELAVSSGHGVVHKGDYVRFEYTELLKACSDAASETSAFKSQVVEGNSSTITSALSNRRVSLATKHALQHDLQSHTDPLVLGILRRYAQNRVSEEEETLEDALVERIDEDIENIKKQSKDSIKTKIMSLLCGRSKVKPMTRQLDRRTCYKLFDSVDLDKSGEIDKEELISAFKKMKLILTESDADIIIQSSSVDDTSAEDHSKMDREEFVRVIMDQVKRKQIINSGKSGLKSIKKPFSVDDDAFYFPQRMIIAFTISIITNMTLFLTTSSVMQSVSDKVNQMGSNAIRTIFVGIDKVESLYFQMFGFEMSDGELYQFIEAASILQKEFEKLAFELWIAMFIGCAISVVAYCGSFIGLMRSFRQTALLMRRGDHSTFNRKKHKLADASNYIGIQISNGIVTYFLILVIGTFAAFPFTCSMLRGAIFSSTTLSILIPIIATAVVNIILKKTFGYKLATNAKPHDHVKMRRLYHLYDAVQIMMTMAAGFMLAFIRFIITCVIALGTLPFMDRSPIPAWVERYLLLDTGSKSYHSMILLYHTFNHPLHISACWMILEDSRRRKALSLQEVSKKDEVEGIPRPPVSKPEVRHRYLATAQKWNGKKRGTGYKRWHLALMLHNYPYLRHFRAHALKAARLAQEMHNEKQKLLSKFPLDQLEIDGV